jgi:hypothetical protein
MRYPDDVRYHAKHGESLDQCDAWVCVCGNRSHLAGFYPCDRDGNGLEPLASGPWDGRLYYCDACRRIIDQTTGAVVGFRTPDAKDYS